MSRKIFFMAISLATLLVSGCGAPPPESPLPPVSSLIQPQGQQPADQTQEQTQESSSQAGVSVVKPGEPAYTAYSKEDYAALKGKKPFVLFFHANWCPICRRMETDILADLKNFPQNTIILKADYDKETELKQEYGITIQSTVVVVDALGNVVLKATDPAMEDFKAAIAKSLE